MGDVELYRAKGGGSLVVDSELDKRSKFAVAEGVQEGANTATDPAVAEKALDSAKCPAVAGKAEKCPAVADGGGSLESPVESVEALKWSTGLSDTGIILGLLATLPDWSVKEQALTYGAREMGQRKQPPAELTKVNVRPPNSQSRDTVAEALDKHLRSRGVGARRHRARGGAKNHVFS